MGTGVGWETGARGGAFLLSFVCLLPLSAAELPEGFSETEIAAGITGAVAMAVAPDGRVFICEQTGALRLVKDDVLLPAPVLTVDVDSFWERGLIGVTLDPGFPDRPYLYLNYVSPRPHPHHRLSRFTLQGDSAIRESELMLFEGDNQDHLGGSVQAGHQGGAIRFGKDGKLYIGIGEQTAGSPAQRLDSILGKVLRINPDGSIPSDNPFFARATGKYRAIWALGLRNPFALAVHPETGRIFMNDVGGAAWEEINEGIAGANYGWPKEEGAGSAYRGPIHAYTHATGKSIAGAVFYHAPRPQFPSRYVGKYFFLDFDGGWIRVLDPDNPRSVSTFATRLPRPVDLQVGIDGSLYCLNRNAWVKDQDFRPGTGTLVRIRYTGKRPDQGPVARAGRTARPGRPVAPTESPALSMIPNGGGFSGPVTVRLLLAGAATGATLRYTTDGTLPTSESPLYREPVVLASSAIVTARLFDGGAEGAVFRANFVIRGSVPYGLPYRDAVTSLEVPPGPEHLPPLLSRTGVFLDLAALTPSPGIIPYDVNSALWSDGAYKSRWIAPPGSARISFAPKGEWGFPAGTVFIKHFELPLDEARPERRKRLETRLLVVGDSGSGYGATYKWRADGSDADLLSESLTEEVAVRTPDGFRPRKWYYPSRSDCLVCHTQPAGFVLGVKTRQLNGPLDYAASGVRDNQLRTWNHLQMFEPSIREEGIPGYDRLCAISDNVAPLEHRVRSYLDSNCANCHRPGGARGLLDTRYDTPLAEQNIIEGALVAGDLDTPGARSVVPGDLSRSILYQRMKRLDVFKMPPLAMNEPDSAALSLFAEWIQSLP